MATNLKKTNVVVIGLGAAGGTAVLPLTRAGLDVVGLDAREATSELGVLVDQVLAKFKNVQAESSVACCKLIIDAPRISPA